MIRLSLLLATLIAFSATGTQVSAQMKRQPTAEQERTLKRFLHKSGPGERNLYAFVQLKEGQPPAVIVYSIGPDICGSGGCNLEVLVPRGASYRVVCTMNITRLPIRVLQKKTNGWHALGVWVQGGGIQPGYEAELDFNGRKYPGNPSVPPAHPSNGAPGEILISREQF
jgi:hypothetical protein